MPRPVTVTVFPFDQFGGAGTGAGAKLLGDAVHEILDDTEEETRPCRADCLRGNVDIQEHAFETMAQLRDWRKTGRTAAESRPQEQPLRDLARRQPPECAARTRRTRGGHARGPVRCASRSLFLSRHHAPPVARQFPAAFRIAAAATGECRPPRSVLNGSRNRRVLRGGLFGGVDRGRSGRRSRGTPGKSGGRSVSGSTSIATSSTHPPCRPCRNHFHSVCSHQLCSNCSMRSGPTRSWVYRYRSSTPAETSATWGSTCSAGCWNIYF